jgi:hypothetical protein
MYIYFDYFSQKKPEKINEFGGHLALSFGVHNLQNFLVSSE